MQTSELHIRRMKRGDLPTVQFIEKESFADPWAWETLEEAVSTFSDTVFVAEIQGEVKGYIICGIEDTGEERYGHICSLAVASDIRRGGFGRALVRRAEHAAVLHGATAMQLEVRVSNKVAQQFYSRLGYESVFHICGYYADTEDAIVMMRWFRY